MHFCQDELTALLTAIPAIGLAWRWLKAKASSIWRRVQPRRPPPHEITSDGKSVWVNGSEGLLGRFGPNGIDVHQPATAQLTGGECLHCSHARTTRADWDVFVQKMKEHWGILVPQDVMPDRFGKTEEA